MNYSNLIFFKIFNYWKWNSLPYIYLHKQEQKKTFPPSKSFNSVHEWIFKILKLESNNFMHDKNMNGIEHPPKCKLDSVLF